MTDEHLEAPNLDAGDAEHAPRTILFREVPAGAAQGANQAYPMIFSQVIEALADPAVAVATATAGATVANKLIGEAGKTLRQSMIERTNRQNGATSAGLADDEAAES